jgi:hypothetical protein
MSRTMRIFAIAVAGSIVAAVLVTPGAHAAQTYSDPTGDSGTAADIASVSVSNTADGTITFALSFANRAAPTADDVFAIFIDADKNSATGDGRFGGVENVIFVDNGDRTIDFGRWTGSDYDFATRPPTLHTNDGKTISINRSELGNTSGFAFLVFTTNAADQVDTAPNEGALFVYDLTAGEPAVPRITGVVIPLTVLFPNAGGVLNARAIQLRVDDGAIVRPTSMTCTLKFRGRALRPLAGGCRWRIPKSLKGKSLSLTITARYRGATVTRSLPVKVE